MENTIVMMNVINRHGEREVVSFDKITQRITLLCDGLHGVDPFSIAKDVVSSMYDGIPTSELDDLSARICAGKGHIHPDYGKLGGRILASNISKNTSGDYKTVVELLHRSGILSDIFLNFVMNNHLEIQQMFEYERDSLFDYFAMRTLQRSYLIKVDDKIVERPQHLFMRLAIQIHGCHNGYGLSDQEKLLKIKETYDLVSSLYFTHATPSLFNSGRNHPQLGSCFIIGMSDDIEGIFKTISDVAKISKWAGGIGLSLSNIRAKGSRINGTNGKSDGIIPLCKTLESVCRYINQGGLRPGSLSTWLEPWHADIFSFVELRKNTGDENLRARDLFLGLWIPDLFIKRVQENGIWSLMCPNECPGLVENYGEKFEQLYTQYEKDGKYRRQVPASELWKHIIECQLETGIPYLSFKDHVNNRNMQSQLGTIRCANLCNEISLYSDAKTYATCNLASICLPRFIENGVFNFDKLRQVVEVITYNLNNVIDVNFYPTPETEETNKRNRPLGIGVQGLADVYCILGFPFASKEARQLNKLIFENIYFASVKMSVELAKKYGKYESFAGSQHSQGKLQFHLWDETVPNRPTQLTIPEWPQLIADFKQYGMRNSLLTALMPTASTSQIMGNSECFEPLTSNHYLRRTSAGEFEIFNTHLVRELIKRHLWSDGKIYEELLYDSGSVQKIQSIPSDLKEIYKTVYELKVKDILDQAIDRSPFIDHQQSMNLFLKEVDLNVLNSSHMYSWKNGLKTGLYYCRTQLVAKSTKFVLEPAVAHRIEKERSGDKETKMVKPVVACPRDPYLRAMCESCSA